MEEREEYPYWKNEIQQKTGKRKRYISYKPKNKQLSEMLARQPQKFFLDGDGRLYGIIRDVENPVYIDMYQKGIISQNSGEEGGQLLFVWLPNSLRGDFSTEKKRRNKGYSGLLPDELLEMPEAPSIIQLHRYSEFDSGPAIEMEILEYCERNTRNTRISLILGSLHPLQ